jgi:hypothetical protein
MGSLTLREDIQLLIPPMFTYSLFNPSIYPAFIRGGKNYNKISSKHIALETNLLYTLSNHCYTFLDM